jgi:hypothetical protein
MREKKIKSKAPDIVNQLWIMFLTKASSMEEERARKSQAPLTSDN